MTSDSKKPIAADKTLYLGLILIYLIPIWIIRYFPTTDGPAHIANAKILLEYLRSDHGLIHQYYSLNNSLDPNWFGHIVLAALGSILPMLTAEKVLLSGYIILFPLSVLYAVKSVAPERKYWAFLAFPFIYNYLFQMGFYNFTYSLVLFFFVVGYWLRYMDAMSGKRIAALTVLLLLLYFCHIVSLVMTMAGMGIILVFRIAQEQLNSRKSETDSKTGLMRHFRIYGLPLVYAYLPTIVLAAGFILKQGLRHPAGGVNWSVTKKLIHLASMTSLVSYSKVELLPSIGIVLFFSFVTAAIIYRKISRRTFDRPDSLLAVCLFYILIYFLSPYILSGGSYLNPRIMLYPFFILILWFASQDAYKMPERVVIGTAVILGLTFNTMNFINYKVIDRYLDEYMSAGSRIEAGSTVLPLIFAKEGIDPTGKPLSLRISPFVHASGLIVVQNEQVVDLANYEAMMGYFPMVFKAETNPYRYIGKIEGEPPRVDILNYPALTHGKGRIDYVLLWGLSESERHTVAVKKIFDQLAQDYDLVYTSQPNQLAKLYRKRKGDTHKNLKAGILRRY